MSSNRLVSYMKKHNQHHQPTRLIGRNGQMNLNIIRLGSSPLGFRDLYHWFLISFLSFRIIAITRSIVVVGNSNKPAISP